jgi:hypothetical protein
MEIVAIRLIIRKAIPFPFTSPSPVFNILKTENKVLVALQEKTISKAKLTNIPK